MDLGLNEFRLDLIAYNKEHPNLDVTPLGLNGVVPSSDLLPPGVIYVLKNCNEGINIDRKNQLHPFYMIYLSREGQVICDHLSPKRLLDLMRLACKGGRSPIKRCANYSIKRHKMVRRCLSIVVSCRRLWSVLSPLIRIATSIVSSQRGRPRHCKIRSMVLMTSS